MIKENENHFSAVVFFFRNNLKFLQKLLRFYTKKSQILGELDFQIFHCNFSNQNRTGREITCEIMWLTIVTLDPCPFNMSSHNETDSSTLPQLEVMLKEKHTA